ncbi:periplasmic heavy metal sensor [Deltaproteobacteria bacterium OttesenSCG-928-K17]|nr:periplasmic heavy metal sensor [Deltaproteobacteria bacterium OttesenSCG-928-K17]
MKKNLIPAAAVMMVMLVGSGAAMAQDGKKNPPPPPAPMAEMSAEDQAAIDKIFDDHRLKTAPLRDQLWAKRMEYDALANNPNVKPDEIRAIIADMGKIKTQLRTERDGLRAALKEKGFDREEFRGYHRRHQGRFWGPGDHDFDFEQFGPRHGRGPARPHHKGGWQDN